MKHSDITIEPQSIALRAYAASSFKPDSRKRSHRNLDVSSEWSIVFDCETTNDETQNLRVGAYQVYHHFTLWQQGLILNHESLSDDDLHIINSYANEHDLSIKKRFDFIEEILFGIGYDLRAAIVGFNLPFDIARVAIRQNSARGKSFRGGFTFQLSSNRYRPNIQIKHLNSRASLIQFTAPPKQLNGRGMRRRGINTSAMRGFFIDVKTLAAAITAQSHSLESLTGLLQTKNCKYSTEAHGEALTYDYLNYAILDVQCTWECYVELKSRYEKLHLHQTSIHKIFSEAGLGKAYFKEMGIKSWMESQPDFPDELIGILMSSYYGGRSEIHHRREIVQVLYCDFLSMYPTVCTLMGLWRYVTAQGINWSDSTNEIQALLDNIHYDDLKNQEVWSKLAVLAQVLPDDDVFPVRAKYNDSSSYTIALNRLTSEEVPLWFTLADCIASKILTGRTPKIVKALSFTPKAVQEDLKPINIAGNSEYRVDPYHDDFFRRLIELRTQAKQQLDMAKSSGNCSIEAQLHTEQLALKITANSTSYGIFVELNVNEYDRLQEIECFGGNGESFPTLVHSIESPGNYFHPLIATLITGAARLKLALAEKLTQEAGIDWAFCDTDSMALSRLNGMSETQFLKQANWVQDWFTSLNPYKEKGPIFKIEDVNFKLKKGKKTKELETLYCLTVSSKRYALFNLDASNRPIIRKASAHGLGHLRPPYAEKDAPKSIPTPCISLIDIGVERWQYDLWYQIILAALKDKPDQVDLTYHPALSLPAVSRYSATSPHLLRWFKTYNEGKPYSKQVKPFNFLLMFQASNINHVSCIDDHEERIKLKYLPKAIAPFCKDSTIASDNCFDRNTGKLISKEQLKTYAQCLAQYHLHPEDKFHFADYLDRGIVQRRHIQAIAIEYIGKEANRWEEQLYLGENPEAQIEYGVLPEQKKRLRGSTLTFCRPFGPAKLAQQAGLSVSDVSDILQGKRNPRVEIWLKLMRAAQTLETQQYQADQKDKIFLEMTREICNQQSARKIAKESGIDHANLSHILNGKRNLTASMRAKLEPLLGNRDLSNNTL